MEKFKRFEKNTLITMLAFIVPALIMLLIFYAGEFYPFGKVSVLVADMRYQFVDYIGYMKSVFAGDNDLFYTFSKTFGGDMMGFSAYYLFNPFFLLLLFFENDVLPEGIVIMMILICGFMGLNFHLMLRAIWGNRFSSVIFSTAYALMGYNVAYINCIHYFFSVMMLPLVILGLYRMMTNRRPSGIYIAAVSMAVISNYYIGYMILIFTAAFFVCFMASGAIEYKDMRDRVRNAWTVLYSTLLAVGISAFSLLPEKRERLARETKRQWGCSRFDCRSRSNSPLEPPSGKIIEISGLRPVRLSLRRSSNDCSATHILFRAARRIGFTCFNV